MICETHSYIDQHCSVCVIMMRITMSGWAGVMMVLVMVVLCSEAQPEKVPALFVFGDSLVDVGNNNYLRTIARANYYPYGIDFGGHTGRFSNGKILIDFIGDQLGVPSPPAYTNLPSGGEAILHGVNFASANAGILEESGRHYGERYSLSQQVQNFDQTLKNYRSLMNDDPKTQFLAKSIAVIVIGNGDYISNYLLPGLYGSSSNYTVPQFANLLLNSFLPQLEALHSLGLRKFFIAGLGPLGCIPNQRAVTLPGRCRDLVNQMVQPFNVGLKSMVNQLNKNHSDSMFIYGNTYGILADVLNNQAAYSFAVIDRACCGLGLAGRQIACVPMQIPCLNRSQYFFWDSFHPTQSGAYVYAWRVVNGPPTDSYPMNIKQLALL